MQKFNRYIDLQLEKMGYLISRRKYVVLIAVLALIVFLASNLPKTTVDTSTEGFLKQSDPTRIAYDAFRQQFGRDEKLVVAVKVDDVFKKDNLEKLKELHNELAQNVPYLNDISSLINARNTQGDKDSLIVDDLFKVWPQTDRALDALKQLAVSNPMYQNILLSEDGTFTLIVMESNTYSAQEKKESVDAMLEGFDEEVPGTERKKVFLTDKENSQMVMKVEEIINKYRSDDFKIYFAGSPAVTAFLKSTMMKDMAKFNALIILTIIIFLILLFKRASAVLLPLVAVLLAVVSTMGMMAFTGTPIKTMTQILPSFLLAVGIGASVHILAIFYKHLDRYHDKTKALAHTLKHSGLAIVMTSLTTAAGLASFSFSDVAPVADLGTFASLGVMLSLLYTLVLLPALLMIFPIKIKPLPEHTGGHDWMDRLLAKAADFSYTHAKAIVIVSLLFMVATMGFATHIKYSHNPLEWFKKDHPVRVATEVIDKNLKGSISLELIIDTQKENGLYDYKTLKSIEALSDYAMTLESDQYFVGKAISVVDIIKEIHKALNENRASHYVVPSDAKLISQEILLFENSGSDDLEDVVDSRFSKARLTIKVPWIEAFAYHDLLKKLHTYIDANFSKEVKITMTGMIPLLAETVSAAIESSGVSYTIAFVVISLMMMLLLSSVRLGLVSMIPNLFPIMIVLAIMVIFDLPLDLFTMLIGSIVIGMAVDDTVHFMHNFRRHYLEHSDVQEAITYTLTGTGRAMTVTSIVLSIGFFIYLFAGMNNLFAFGLLTGIAIVTALIADVILAPALLVLYYGKKRTPLKEKE